jgi:hypothetical protein
LSERYHTQITELTPYVSLEERITHALAATEQAGVLDNSRKAIGFWMTVQGADPIEPIRVFVTCETLAQIDPSQLRDAHDAFETLDKHRRQIETAASLKFDADGPDDDTYDGQPIVTLRYDDLPLE